MIDAYERKHENRATITDPIAKLTGDEPWSDCDEQSAEAITTALNDTDARTAQKVKTYERSHKSRAGVIQTAEKRIERSETQRLGRPTASRAPPRPADPVQRPTR